MHHPVVSAIAAAHGVSPYQVAIRWILQHGHLLTFQSVSKAHQAVDANVFGFELSAREMASLDSVQSVDKSLHGSTSWVLALLVLAAISCVMSIAFVRHRDPKS